MEKPKTAKTGIEKPEFPEKDENRDRDKRYQFNLGLYRIELLAEILKVCAKKYRKAIMNRDSDSLNDYKAMVNTLYTETFIYMETETDFDISEHSDMKMTKEQVLTKFLDDFTQKSREEEVVKELKEVRSIYLEIRKLLKNVGMDIPEEEKIGKTEAFIDS